ncbi:MAG: hypothetical protein WC291_07175 [Thermodesulfovibrionales bacterium]|jgi:hypothetical protein
MMMTVRPARASDAEGLLHLERHTTMDGGFRVGYEKKDFFAKTSLFEASRISVIEEDGRIIGTLSGGLKEARIQGKKQLVCSLFDLRLRKGYGYRDKKGIYLLVKDFEGWIYGNDVSFVYGMVKADNRRAIRFVKGLGFHPLSTVRFTALPVFREQRLRNDPFTEGYQEIAERINSAKKGLELFAERGLQPEPRIRLATALESGDSFACCRVWDPEKKIVIHRLSPPLSALSLITKLAARGLSIPYFPGRGERLKYWIVADSLSSGAEGPALFRRLLKRVNNLALRAGVSLLIVPLDQKDSLSGPLRGLLSPGFDYQLCGRFVKGETLPDLGPLDLDVRDY